MRLISSLPCVLLLALASPTAHATPQSICETALENETPGQDAVRGAPDEVRALLRHAAIGILNINGDWSLSGYGLLETLGVPEIERRSLAQQALHRFFARAPMRAGANLRVLTSGMPTQPRPATTAPVPDLPVGPSPAEPFSVKYNLQAFAQMRERVLNEILPEDFRTNGHYWANFDRHFRSSDLEHAYRLALAAELDKEAQTALIIMLIQDEFRGLARSAELSGNDQLLYNAGLYALARFYSSEQHRYHPNYLWDAVETLKRVRSPALRAQVRTLFADLSDDLLSAETQATLRTALGTEEDFRSSYSIILSSMEHALSSSGDILYRIQDDAVKVTFVTDVRDAHITQTLRRVVAAAESAGHTFMPWDLAAAFISTHDQKSLAALETRARARGDVKSANLYRLAITDPQRGRDAAYSHHIFNTVMPPAVTLRRINEAEIGWRHFVSMVNGNSQRGIAPTSWTSYLAEARAGRQALDTMQKALHAAFAHALGHGPQLPTNHAVPR